MLIAFPKCNPQFSYVFIIAISFNMYFLKPLKASDFYEEKSVQLLSLTSAGLLSKNLHKEKTTSGKRPSSDQNQEPPPPKKPKSSKIILIGKKQLSLLQGLCLLGEDSLNKTLNNLNTLYSDSEDSSYEEGLSRAFGLGSNKNLEEAVKYFSIAAEQGNKKAQYCLAIFYGMGWGFQDKHRSTNKMNFIKYLVEASNQGYQSAKNLYNLYCETPLNEEMPEKEYPSHFNRFYERISEGSHDPYGSYAVGIFCAFGWGIERNIDEAIKLLENSSSSESTVSEIQDFYDHEANFILGSLQWFEKNKHEIKEIFKLPNTQREEDQSIVRDLFNVWERKNILNLQEDLRKIKNKLVNVDETIVNLIYQQINPTEPKNEKQEKQLKTLNKGETEPISNSTNSHPMQKPSMALTTPNNNLTQNRGESSSETINVIPPQNEGDRTAHNTHKKPPSQFSSFNNSKTTGVTNPALPPQPGQNNSNNQFNKGINSDQKKNSLTNPAASKT